LMDIEGVKAAVPVIRNITPNSKGRFGIIQIDGVDWAPFAEMKICILSVDERQQQMTRS